MIHKKNLKLTVLGPMHNSTKFHKKE